jgi:prepilin-type N-terminal cleavage/methylation domain-containing protein
MECNATSTDRSRNRSGFTLLEMMVAVGIGGIILAAVAALNFHTGRSFAALLNYADLDRHSRNSLDQMIMKIRQADELIEFSTNKVVFTYQGTNRLSYEYFSGPKTMVETLGNVSKTLLTGCDTLCFSAFQRNTAAGTYDQFPASMTNNAAKLIQVSWTCSRSIVGARINTESVQSAKIVMRNQ